MRHRIAHHLDVELARKAARRAADSYQQRFAGYSPQVHWEADDRARVGLSARGMSIGGTLELEPGAIVIEVQVPLLLRPLTNRAVAVIEQQVRHWVDLAERGEL